MKKYFVLFCIPSATITEWIASISPEERTKQTDQMMSDWSAWQEKHAGLISDKGMPLGKTKRVTSAGVEDIKNDLNYYNIVEAESSDVVVEMIKECPHFQIPNAYVDVMEIPQMGM